MPNREQMEYAVLISRFDQLEAETEEMWAFLIGLTLVVALLVVINGIDTFTK